MYCTFSYPKGIPKWRYAVIVRPAHLKKSGPLVPLAEDLKRGAITGHTVKAVP